MSSRSHRFAPSLEALDDRLNLSPTPTGTVTFLVDGQGTYFAGIVSRFSAGTVVRFDDADRSPAPDGRKFKILVAPLIEDGAAALSAALFIAKQQAARAGGADSIWLDIDAPVLTAPDGRKPQADQGGAAPTHPDLDRNVWVGAPGGSHSGPGVYKSEDSGRTW